MNLYSPSGQEQYSAVPEHIATATEAQGSLQTATSEVQGAKGYIPSAAGEFAVSTHSDLTTNYTTMTTLTTNGYSYSHPSTSPTALMSPVPYTVPTAYNTAFGEAIGIGTYPSMSPSGYVSPYGTKQYTWPNPPGAVGYPSTFSMSSHDLAQSCYPYSATTGTAYSQVAVSRPSYPGSYFPAGLGLTVPATQNC